MATETRPPRERAQAATLRAAIDRGETGDKVAGGDPAAAPLGTDDEAAGAGPTPAQVGAALRAETSRGTAPPSRAAEGGGAGSRRVGLWIGVAAGALLLIALILLLI